MLSRGFDEGLMRVWGVVVGCGWVGEEVGRVISVMLEFEDVEVLGSVST